MDKYTPWEYTIHEFIQSVISIRNSKQEEIACVFNKSEQGYVLAEFIVRAVNSHDDLLEACKAAYTNKTLGEYECQKQGLPRHIEVLEKLAQAIAKAKGD